MTYVKKVLLSACVALILHVASRAQEDAVTIDHVDGQADQGAIRAGIPLTFYFRFTVATRAVICPQMGQRLYSPDGATWVPPTISAAVFNLPDYWDGGIFYYNGNSDGNGADTLGFVAFNIFKPGLPVGYDDLVYKITTSLDTSQIGKTLCVDSSWFPDPSLEWSWLTSGPTVYPSWDGPHCYEIVCCGGMRGNVDYDPMDKININDLDELIDYLFRGGPTPICLDEANIDGSGSINIADLDYFVDYLFRGGPPPPMCP